ncbi:DUF805 domain-containing protein [Telmatobacter sp. DSM 110680]|uniref:DUF805 domain-containing protein n=1 Tax=Telmatobacter sp. DSM 110680 TaxID=3036704 RepID=A0AAU7DFL6_9BACT
MSSFFLAWKRAMDFEGRSSRKEYWMFQLANILLMLVLLFFALGITIIAAVVSHGTDTPLTERALLASQILFAVFICASFVPSYACLVRRLHDTGKSAAWTILLAVPVLGFAVYVFAMFDSFPGSNRYGSSPKALTTEY